MGIGIKELLVILFIVVLVFGTRKLRNMGGDLGGALKNFKDAMKGGQKDDQVADDKEDGATGTTIEGEVTSKTKEKV